MSLPSIAGAKTLGPASELQRCRTNRIAERPAELACPVETA